MPTVAKKSTAFRDATPKALQGLYDFLADDPMGGLSPASLGMAAKQSVPPAVRALVNMLRKNVTRNVDPAARALSQRVTPRRAYGPTPLELPPDFEFAGGASLTPKMSPISEKAYAAQLAFDTANRLKTPTGNPSPFRPRQAPAASRGSREMRKEVVQEIHMPRATKQEDIPLEATFGPKQSAQQVKKPLSSQAAVQRQKARAATAKFSEQDVRSLREEHAKKPLYIPKVAKQYGVSPATLQNMLKRDSYGWVK